MKFCETASPKRAKKGYADTARILLDSLIFYRSELGETGRQLERLLRIQGVMASTDLPYQQHQLH